MESSIPQILWRSCWRSRKIKFSGFGASHQNRLAEHAIKTVVPMSSAILMQAWMIYHNNTLSIDYGELKWAVLYGSKVGSMIYSILYKLSGNFLPYMFWSQGFISLDWKPLNGLQWVKEGLIWALARLFNTSWVDYEHDEWFKITSVSYYLDDILYSVVRSTAPDTEFWIRLVPSRNSRIKVMLDQ